MILVTGGAGFVGSHACVALANAGYELVIVDDLSNASEDVFKRLADITGKSFTFVKGDIRDRECLRGVFSRYEISAVMHFAGLKAVRESVKHPFKYYSVNVAGTLTLLEVMREFHCKSIVFSSSATVYGDPDRVPVPETAPLRPSNPYSRSKLAVKERSARRFHLGQRSMNNISGKRSRNWRCNPSHSIIDSTSDTARVSGWT